MIKKNINILENFDDSNFERITQNIMYYLLSLSLLYQLDRSKKFAKLYADKTYSSNGFGEHNTSKTKLYFLLHQLSILKNKVWLGNEFKYARRIKLNESYFLDWLKNHNKTPSSDNIFLRNVYNMFSLNNQNINNLINVLPNWKNLKLAKQREILELLIKEFRKIDNRNSILFELELIADDINANIKDKKGLNLLQKVGLYSALAAGGMFAGYKLFRNKK